MVRHLVFLFGCGGLTLLSYINIYVKVLARRGIVVPARAFLCIWLFLDTNLLLELLNACFVFVSLLLVVRGALFGRDLAFLWLLTLFQIFLLCDATLFRIANCKGCGLLPSENARIIYIHVEGKLLLLESDLLLLS